MPEKHNPVAISAALVLVAGGILVSLGWQLRIGILKGELLGTYVSPNAALLFILIGTSCLLQFSSKSILVRAGQALGILVTVFAAALLSEHLLGVDLGIDRRFLSKSLSGWTVPTPPGRPALTTSLAFLFGGLGLIGMRTPRAGNAVDWCAALVGAISYLGFIGYGYGLPKLYGGVMAIPTAILLSVVALALGTARADSIITNRNAGGVVFRRVISALLVLMPLVGVVGIRVQHRFSLTVEMGTALLVVVVVFLFTAITAHTASVLNELDVRRKHFEKSLIRADKLAVAGRLSATIAHEINNPLAAITNLLYLAGAEDSDARRIEYIRIAEDELRRVAEIAKRTLAFYRDDTQPVEIALSATTREVLDVFQRKLSSSQIRVDMDLSDTATVSARPGEIRQIISNLLANAIDAVAGQHDPRITVAVRELPGLVQLTIGDNGSGIPSEQLSRIFEPFFTTKQDVGSGLGLYISRQLAEKNRGFLQIESSTNPERRGTTLSLTLPLCVSIGEPLVKRAVATPAPGART